MSSSRPKHGTSRSKGTGRLQVRGGRPGLEVAVLNSDFEQVALGVGGLDVELDAGLYEVQFRTGAREESQLVKLAGGAAATVAAPALPIPSAAPVVGTSTSHEYHQDAAARASVELRAKRGSSGVVVMVRNVRGQDGLRFDAHVGDQLALVDGQGGDIQDSQSAWHVDLHQKWAYRVLAAPPGGCGLALRTPGRRAVEQALWLSDGWQTVVFIPNTTAGPAPEHATIHMTRMDLGWLPFGESSDAALALEGALWGLRTGRPIVPRDLDVLLRRKFENPILGIVGAHVLLLDPQPRLKLLEQVVTNLAELVPAHPDVVALRYLVDAAAGREFAPQPPVAWPPLLLASYDGLVGIDAMHPGVLESGSLAEDVGARLVVQGLWTSWSPQPRERSLEESAHGGAAGHFYLPSPSPSSSDPAIERLSAYVEGAADVRGVPRLEILDSSPESLARATGLPIGSVERAVKELLS